MDALKPALLRLANDVAVDVFKLDAIRRRSVCCRSSARCRGRRIGHRLAFGDRAELLDEIGNVYEILWVAVADVVDHLLEGIEALEEDIDDVLVELELFLADEIEDVLHLVRKLCDLVVAHRRGHALQRVRIAENIVDDRYIVLVFLQLQETFVQGLQMFV